VKKNGKKRLELTHTTNSINASILSTKPRAVSSPPHSSIQLHHHIHPSKTRVKHGQHQGIPIVNKNQYPPESTSPRREHKEEEERSFPLRRVRSPSPCFLFCGERGTVATPSLPHLDCLQSPTPQPVGQPPFGSQVFTLKAWKVVAFCCLTAGRGVMGG